MPEYINCQIVVIPGGKYDFKPYAIGYQKDSPYAEIFDFHIDMLRQTGMLQGIASKYRGAPQKCPDYRWRQLPKLTSHLQQGTRNNFSGKPFTWATVFPAFGVFFVGGFMSVLLLITELLLGKSKVGKMLMNSYNYMVTPPPPEHSNVISEEAHVEKWPEILLVSNLAMLATNLTLFTADVPLRGIH